jgi:hydrogenase maturation protease
VLTLVVGVGNAWRGDDAAGLAVARRVRELGGAVAVRELEGDASALLDAWEGHAAAAVVDAAVSGAPPGTLHRFWAGRDRLPAPALRSSTHAFGVADAVALARALHRLPDALEVFAIEGESFALGAGLSAPVARAVESLARELAAGA